MFKYLFVFILFLNCTPLFAQNYEKEYETQFLWEVKQINEFIERFNNTDTTLLKQYYKKNDSLKVLTREKLIKSLFNAQKTGWNFAEIESFIKDANNIENPKYLNFFADNWCAKVNCTVTWKGKPEIVLLTLRLQQLQHNSYKWIINSAEAGFLKTLYATNKAAGMPEFRMPAAVDSTTSLNPMSHTTDFMNIDRITDDKVNIANYFTDISTCSNETKQFVQECLNAHLKIKGTTNVVYNFNQIKGWDIEIQQYNRASNNSGWLISKLTKTSSN